jgi:CRP/FNR family transcriptional regulator, cyclic AMP receptor protein
VLRTIPKQVLEAVHAIPLFSTCNTKELREIARLGTESTIAAGQTITTEDTVGKELVIILEGSATCRVHGRKLAHFGPGDFFGEMSLLDKGPRSATVTADTDMGLLVLDGREFHRLIQTSPTVAWKILQVMAGRLRNADKSLSH